MATRNRADRPPAYVLSHVGTGLATVRSLAAGAMNITALTYGKGREAVHFSRYCEAVQAPAMTSDEEHAAWLAECCAREELPPILFPTSDGDALMLAKYAEILRPVACFWSTTYPDLFDIVNKQGLYSQAAAAGLPTIPSLIEPGWQTVEEWCRRHPAPYLLKPFYSGMPQSSLKVKNLRFGSAADLLNYIRKYGAQACIVQPMILGGDGYIVDIYGLSDPAGRALVLADHRRWRQYPPHVGVTSFGEIPVRSLDTSVLFDYTRCLVARTRYHGIFGIEWLLDRRTHQWYLLDFNARPFSSIGHLTDCGLNLPLLAYRELVGFTAAELCEPPALRHYYWINFRADLCGFIERRDLSWFEWLRSIVRCRSFACASWKDPAPQIFELWDLTRAALRAVRRGLRRYLWSPMARLRARRSAWT